MSDDLNGGSPADDAALFSSAVSNQPQDDPQTIASDPAPVASQPEPQNTQPNAANPDPAIPPARLREEADARRKAENEVAELRGRLAAMEQRLNQPAKAPEEPKAKREIWEDPDGFVADALTPVQQQLRQQAERISMRFAVKEYGQETVAAAYSALDKALEAGDPNAHAEYQRIRASDDPFDGIVQWHKRSETLREVGIDPAAYRNRVLEEALKDPEFLKRALESTRTQAQTNGNTIAQPARPQVQSLPSLNKVGSVALPDNGNEASDAEMFASATRRRAR